jgi:hypothetical protein
MYLSTSARHHCTFSASPPRKPAALKKTAAKPAKPQQSSVLRALPLIERLAPSLGAVTRAEAHEQSFGRHKQDHVAGCAVVAVSSTLVCTARRAPCPLIWRLSHRQLVYPLSPILSGAPPPLVSVKALPGPAHARSGSSASSPPGLIPPLHHFGRRLVSLGPFCAVSPSALSSVSSATEAPDDSRRGS